MPDHSHRIAEATERLHEACERQRHLVEAGGGTYDQTQERELTILAQDSADATRVPLHLILLKFTAAVNAESDMLEHP